MGCGPSAKKGRDVAPRMAGPLTPAGQRAAQARLRRLRTLDANTKEPFLLVELRGEADRHGFVELCGKDEYGVYKALDEWLTSSFGCTYLETTPAADGPFPFCDRAYAWQGFVVDACGTGTSSMGLNTMRLVDFMCNTLGWTLGVVNGGNVGKLGDIREQQVIFKAPHPMNLVVPHFMVELRSAGFIEVCGAPQHPMLDSLEAFLERRLSAQRLWGFEGFCDRYYKCDNDVFVERGDKGDNNLGLLTIKIVDFICKGKPWSLVTMTSGHHGAGGHHREKQLIFRLDNHPLGASPHLMVELRESGFVEVNGDIIDGIYPRLEELLQKTWGCEEVHPAPGDKPLCHKMYSWDAPDMLEATAEVTSFFHEQGWQLLVCAQGAVKDECEADSREQQMLFRPAEDGYGIIEPHLIMELQMGDGIEKLYTSSEETQVLKNQCIKLAAVGDCKVAMQAFREFAVTYLGGWQEDDWSLRCDIFMCRGVAENNLGCWTMRICDFMVDRMGWSFVVCNTCNLGKHRRQREQQLIFRYDGERREIPVTGECELFADHRRGDYVDLKVPRYWRLPAVIKGLELQALAPCTRNEQEALQEILDVTFRRVLTRDRVHEQRESEEMPYRLELVQAFRCENVPLMHRFQKRRELYTGGSHFVAKTQSGGSLLNARLGEGEALLFHGTCPSSSISILKGGFVLRNAGKNTGTMFGYGVYLAECSSKSDEYARDDGGGTFPGLRSLVVCRTLVGKPLVVQEAGDFVQKAMDEGYDCVLGDREGKVGTYKELVFFDETQVLPEYSIIYKRQYSRDAVPKAMQVTATGTTGKCWLVKMEKGWARVPPDANRKLMQAAKVGESAVKVALGPYDYLFDMDGRTQTNLTTGKVRTLQPPRIKSK